jgi:hypothetical protein
LTVASLTNKARAISRLDAPVAMSLSTYRFARGEITITR